MRKKSFILLLIAPILLFALLIQMAASRSAQAAPPRQPADTGQAAVAAEEEEVGDPLPQPLLIRIRQTVPVTYALALLQPFTDTALLTWPASFAVTASAEVTGEAAAGAAGATGEATGTVQATGEPVVGVTGTGLAGVAQEGVTATQSITMLPGVAVPITGTGLITTGQALFATDLLTTTPLLTPSVAATVEVEIELLVVNTLTSTVPATLSVRFSGMPTMSVPISFNLSAQSDALISVVPVELEEAATPTATAVVTEAVAPTPTATLTPAATLTPTQGLPEGLLFVNVTVPVTANVRSGPSTDAEVVRQIPPASTVQVVAQNAAGDWLLLPDGNWIAVVVVDTPPTGLPVATDDLVALLRSLPTPPAPTPAPTPIVTATTAVTPTVTPTATPTATAAVTGTTVPTATGASFPASVTVNANLRSGPGTEFDVIGGTVTGQAINIVARNADGSWFLLDNGGWVSAGLVAGAPPIADIPVFGAAPTTAATPAPPALLPTPTPRPADATGAGATGAITSTPTVEENLYLVEADDAAEKFDQAINTVNRLINAAAGNTAIFSDTAWVNDMNTAIALMRSGGQDISALTPPARLTAAHAQMAAAASAFGQAADLLQSSITAANVALLDQALAQITTAGGALDAGRAALGAFR